MMPPPFSSSVDRRWRSTITATAAALIALLMLRRLQRSSGRLALLTSSKQIAVCRIKRSYLVPASTNLAVERRWQEDEDPEMPINFISLAPDAVSLAVYSSEINQGDEVHQFGRIYDLDAGKLAFDTGSDDIFRGKYLPKIVRSDNGDVPPWLVERQNDYAKLWALYEKSGPVPILTATEGDFRRSAFDGVYWTAAGDFVVLGHVYLVIDVDDENLVAEDDSEEDGHAASVAGFWVRFHREGSVWSKAEQSFGGSAPAAVVQTSALPLALGAPLPSGGRQLLLAGKPLKLPSTLVGGIVDFTGPWAGL